jgi:transposase
MGLKRTDEFRQDAVRIALTSGLTRKQVADDLGVGMSTLNTWITAHRDTDVVSKDDLGLTKAQEYKRQGAWGGKLRGKIANKLKNRCKQMVGVPVFISGGPSLVAWTHL